MCSYWVIGVMVQFCNISEINIMKKISLKKILVCFMLVREGNKVNIMGIVLCNLYQLINICFCYGK